ncbi:isopeptide-forming domain-containing fimbrial protein [Alcanivorax sp. S6407]|uniref:isopeptide-forming domain-containing fimbrial protein n=1 Tax=Alcanivorax sp. S6407 TaxID=2926424 RepID=UPI001FF4DC32|nr:isopeptide-forming domain-containing fimbrial protein [Alcanivorax sp. S6407]MCK0154167.1 isopeptide-forming domain-containing fimbrial protein [Alcanivorax sp. S6407]
MSPNQLLTIGLRQLFANGSVKASGEVSVASGRGWSRPVLLQALFALFLLALSSGALAASFSVSDFAVPASDPLDVFSCELDGPGAVATDGRTFSPGDQLSIDRSCVVKNFTCDDPLNSTLNFASHTPGTLIIFENVCYGGNFACANVEGSAFVWAVNGSDFSSVKPGCQDLIIPVEKIEKSATDLADNPISSVSVGVPFRYTLDIPVLFDPVSGTIIPGYGSLNELGNIVITDDMTPGTLGVDLELLDITASWGPAGSPTGTTMTPGTDFTVTSSVGNPSTPGVLTFEILNPEPLAANNQIHIAIDVMLTDDPLNNIGKSFINVAEWEFSRLIDGTLYDPLPGENGVAELLSISRPDLQVEKTTDSTAVNFSDMPEYSIFVQNVGGAPAWNILVEDQIPLEMRDFDPTTALTVTMAGNLLDPSDYDLTYTTNGPNDGLLEIELLDSAGGLNANEILRIDYTSQLDQPGGSNVPANGVELTNVAAATFWANDISTNTSRVEYTGPRTDGTEDTADNQDLAFVTAALTGYYFEKTVSNVTSGISPAFAAIPGDRLRYRVRLFNLDQEIYNVSITDQLDATRFDISSAAVDPATCPAGATVCAFDGSGLLTVSGAIDVAPSSAQQSIAIEFEVDLLDTLADGDVASNQAQMTAEDDLANPVSASSDDPNVNGVVNQADPGSPASDPTNITIFAPGALLKEGPAGLTEAPIGEIFEYTFTVPQTPVNAPLFDVQVQDALPTALVPTTMLATATVIDGTGTPTGTTYTLTVTDTGSGYMLSENVTGLDLGANERAQITLEVQLANILANQDGVSFSNTATYSYARINGAPQSDPAGTESTTAPITIVEPAVTATKSAINLDGNTPAQGGDTLQYTVTLSSNGSSTAFDTSIFDTLPAGVNYVPGSAEILLNAATTQVDPDVTAGVLTWGALNGDDSLDIPVGEDLVLTYEVVINSAVTGDLINQVDVQWQSQDGAVDGERNGADAPDAAGLNNYFTSATSTVAYADNTAFAKAVQSDTWNDGGTLSTDLDGIVRVGDQLTYALTLSLREGLTEAVTIADTLPAGLEVVSTNYINAANITFTPTSEPLAGDRGAISWLLGDITNTPDADDTNDTLVIEVVAQVLANDPDTLAQLDTQIINNSAELNYTGAAAPLPTGAIPATVNQPVMSEITKVDTLGGRTGSGTNADPYQVDLAADTMQFQLETCNNGDAPAYNLTISDSLATQFDENDLAAAPTVQLGAATLTAGTDFTYTAPAVRGGAFNIVLADARPVDPDVCVTVSYNVGFYTDVTTTTPWSNSATLDNYWSLPTSSGQQYAGTTPAEVWMVNASNPQVPVKVITGQADGEVVIGEQVTYTITIPADNIVRNNVVVTDTLADALVYDPALVTVTVGGVGAAFTDNTAGQAVSLAITNPVPAGQDVVVSLSAVVANTVNTNAGVTFDNTATYTYDGLATPLTSLPAGSLLIVEPLVALTKTGDLASVTAGDVITYTVSLTAAADPNNSDAFDLVLTDTLPAGLEYVAASATVGGVATEPNVTGDPQLLTWPAMDMVEGASVDVVYQVLVRDTVAAGDTLTNNAEAAWTSITGADANERDGSDTDTGGVNDYYATDSATATVPDGTLLSKARTGDTFNTATDDLRVGDRVQFELRIALQEGTTNGLVLTDTLPTGLAFESMVSADFFGTVESPVVTPAAIPSQSGQTLTWTLGNQTNPADGNAANDFLVLVYEARVENLDTLSQTPTTQPLTNAATLDYTVASGPAPQQTANANVQVLQPDLAITKTASAAGGDTIVVAGEVVTYTVAITNNGDAPAYDTVLQDTLPDGMRLAGITTASIDVDGNARPTLAPTYNVVTGLAEWDFGSEAVGVYDIPVGSTLTVAYTVAVDPSVPPSQTLTNSALVTDYYSFDDSDVPANGAPADREDYGPTNTDMATLTTPGPLSLQKEALATQATIGEEFTYRITVPETPTDTALFDVRILDNLAASGVDLTFVSATVVSGGAWTLTNTGTPTNLIIEDTGSGIDIAANSQAVIDITVSVDNTTNNQAGDTAVNTASYTFNSINDNDLTQVAAPGGANDTAAPVTLVEPLLTITKTAANVTAGKAATDPAAGGDTIEYTVTIPNGGNATAFDTTVTDTLPTGMALVANSATALINGADPGFTATPTSTAVAGGTELVWGEDNGGDGSLDIPAGQSLVMTYQAIVTDASIPSLQNSVLADWTSLDTGIAGERTGDGCPTITQPNDYCTAPATATVVTEDNNALAKIVFADSWDDAPLSTANDGILRVGDTVTYELELLLREGATNAVVVSDTLPDGLTFDSVVSINGNTSAPFAAVAPFSHADIPAPTVAGQTVTWNIGDIVNAVNGDSTDNTFVIRYNAVADVNNPATATPSTVLTNDASFFYDGTTTITDSADVEVRQPVIVSVTKTDDLGNSYPSSTSPLTVDIINDTMQFSLEACNDGGSTAPAYSLQLVDTLAPELDETSITTPVVTINGAAQTAGAGYTYTAPAGSGGDMVFDLVTPVNPGQCALVEYSIGFVDTTPANSLWNNSVTAASYWSLPAANGEQYAAVGPAEFWMTNASTDLVPVKTLVSPLSEATIGEQVVYTITVPAANAARPGVIVTDTLSDALVYEAAATTVTVGGNTVVPTDNSAGQNISLTIGDVPAGQEVVVTLTTHVANTANTNAGDVFDNSASYDYTGNAAGLLTSLPSASLTIVEPLLTLTKAADVATAVAGDEITYTVSLTATSGANNSDAFDLVVTDSLPAGLEYVTGSATVLGNPLEPAVTTPVNPDEQVLTWNVASMTEGATGQVVYRVLVRDTVAAGDELINNAQATWTSLAGVDANERDGSDGVGGINDYVTTDTTTVTVPDNTTLAKARVTDTFDPAVDDLRVGDRVQYALTIGLQEGTTNDLVLEDVLPTGLVYEDMVSADFFGTPGTATPTVAGQTLTWNLGNVTNPADGDPANDFLVLTYEARVANLDTLSQTPTTQTLTNTAGLDYTVAGAPVSTADASASSNVLQPLLGITKAVDVTSGVAAGDTLTYTVAITNTGDAPAYDTVLTDTIPDGLRDASVTTSSITLVNAGTTLTNLAPVFDPGTGLATWDFDSGVADAYTIPAGETLQVVYTVQADADLGASLTLENSALVSVYYSFDDEAVPAGGVDTEREDYGPVGPAVATTISLGSGALQKNITQPTAAIGEQFTYEILVPATPVNIALSNVHVLDDLTASAAVLEFVSAQYSLDAGGSWLPMSNVGTATAVDLVDQTSGLGVDVPASGQMLVEITVQLADDATNVAGLTFNNTATYNYDGFTGDPATLADVSEDMTIVAPTLVMTKDGPASLEDGVLGTFTLSVQNTDLSATAWDITLTDHLPNLASGGMCDVAPVITDVSVFESDGTTLVNTLAVGTDYTVNFAPGAGAPDPCVFTLVGESANAAVGPEQILVVTYTAELDAGTPANVDLTNFAGATEWFSADDTAPVRATFTHTLQDVIEDVADPQDYHTLTTVPPTMVFEKTVAVQVDADGDGQPSPGDTLRYTIDVTNPSNVLLQDFSVVDDLGALNAEAYFVPGSLVVVDAAGGVDNSDANGGTNAQGLLDISGLNLDAQGTAGESIQLIFDVTLVDAIDSGTVVLNQGQLNFAGSTLQLSDDPAIGGTEDPTPITILSAPQMQVQKVSADITGDATVLSPGDTLRYTLTVVNIGNEDAINTFLRDAIPQFTTYVPDSTTLNGVAVADPAVGISALESGMLINAPGNTTPGAMDADALAGADATATIVFDVVIDSDALPGTRIVNQGFVAADGAGGTPILEQPSDDPATAVEDDPTVDIVGALPLLDVQKTVAIAAGGDVNGNGAPDPGDTLEYTFTVTNTADIPASNVMLMDQIPAGTTYVAASTTLNGAAQADISGASPLVTGMQINSAGEAAGVMAINSSATVTLQVTIDAATAPGTVIVNQGTLSSDQLPDELSDQDGIDSNGDQPTEITVGEAQQVSITKSVIVVGGGAALPGSELEYTVQVTNEGLVPATQVLITDDVSLLGPDVSYVLDSARLNGGVAGVNVAADVITADYGTAYGDLAPGDSAVLRFRVLLSDTIASGTTITNTGVVTWDNANQTANSSVTTQVGAIPGTATLSGYLWNDVDFDNIFDATETPLVDWEVQAWQNNVQLRTALSGNDGSYSIVGLPETQPGDTYELRFVAPGATATTAPLGYTDSDPAFTDGLQVITDITAAADSLVANLNLPIDPNGVVYNSITREAIAGAMLTMVDSSGSALVDSCFDSTVQQGQVTLASGFYKFDLNFNGANCPSGGDYRIVVTPPAGAFTPGESTVIPPLTGEQTAAYDAVVCAADAIGTTAECEAQVSAAAPGTTVAASSPLTGYYLNLMFAGATADDRQIFNNHIPLDPELGGAVSITKTASVLNVSRGEFVPYVIRINNSFGSDLSDLAIVDSFPAGFKYVKDSARLNDQPVEPDVDGRNLVWNGLNLTASGQHTLKLLFIVGAGVGEGEYVNRAQVFQARTARISLANADAVSGEAQATVRVVPDPDFDCTDVIGKVYDDANMNGYQDDGEAGLPNVRAVTARGLIVTSDQYGRFHITCAVVPNELRGSNFILKVDDRSLPSGYRLTTPNPLVRRATRGKMIKFNFGAALHRVVRLDIANPVFEKDSTEMRLQWTTRMPLLMEQLVEKQSILRIAYMAETEDEGLVDDRLKAMKKRIARQWAELGNPYELVIETEVFWRTGAPLKGGSK